MEDAKFPIEFAAIVRSKAEEGFSPAGVYTLIEFYLENIRLPTGPELSQAWEAKKNSNNFFDAELVHYDRLFKRFGPSRLGFVWENMPAVEYLNLPESNYQAYMDKSASNVKQAVLGGDFKSGLTTFKLDNNLSLQLNIRREERLVRAIINEATSYDQPIGFVGFFGSGHLALPWTLRKNGFLIENHFPQRGDDGAYHFPSHTIFEFKQRFDTSFSPSELEWHKAMLSDTFENLLFNLDESRQNFSDDQKYILAVRGAMAQFESMEDVWNLENKIKEVGWMDALTNL